MPPAFVPVRTPEESRSPHSFQQDSIEPPKPKATKAVSSPLKVKSPTDIAKQVSQSIASEEKIPIGAKSISVQQQQHMMKQPVNVIRPQSANPSMQNGFSSSPVLERKPVITNAKIESERIQSGFGG